MALGLVSRPCRDVFLIIGRSVSCACNKKTVLAATYCSASMSYHLLLLVLVLLLSGAQVS